jgi:hypothetical protein
VVGPTLSHYRILEKFEKGGRGIVCRTLDWKFNRDVALQNQHALTNYENDGEWTVSLC